MRHCCDRLSSVVEAGGSSVQFDSVYREYRVEILPKAFWIDLSFCPFCGAKLPDSLRGDFFVVPSPDEKKRLSALVGGCKGRAELIVKFGNPDFVYAPHHSADPIFGGTISCRSGCLYKNLSTTAVVRVEFTEDDSIARIAIESKCLRPDNDGT